MIELRYILVAVACVLILLISLITMKYRKLLRAKGVEMNKEEVVGRLFLRKIRKLGESTDKEEPGELFKRLNKIMRDFFGELYEISYEFAYVELNEELIKKGVEEETRDTIIDYTMQMAQSEYSSHRMTEQEFYYLLGKSIKTIEHVTGRKEEEPAGKKPEDKQRHMIDTVFSVWDVIRKKIKEDAAPLRKPAEKAEKGKVPPEKKPAEEPVEKYKPKPEVPPEGGDKLEIPHKMEEELEKEMIIPKEDEGKVDKLRRLLVTAEMSMKENKPRDAMDKYIDLRVIYDSLAPDLKIKINPETRRIISLYNLLLKEYKDVLTGKK